jgi:hypothetical protein
VGGKLYMLHVIDLITGIRSMVNKEDWAWVIDYVKKWCIEVAASLIFEFERWFPTQELLNAIGIVYFQY